MVLEPTVHSKAVSHRFALIALAFLSGQFLAAAQAQAPETQSFKTKAELVLTPELCQTVKRFWFIERFRVGKSVCEQLPLALQALFSDLRRVEGYLEANSETPRLTLIPRFVNISVTDQPLLPSSRRKFLIVLEWTVKDSSGNLVWLQTVQGSAERKAWTKKIVRALVDDAVREVARESVFKMRSSAELASLSQ